VAPEAMMDTESTTNISLDTMHVVGSQKQTTPCKFSSVQMRQQLDAVVQIIYWGSSQKSISKKM